MDKFVIRFYNEHSENTKEWPFPEIEIYANYWCEAESKIEKNIRLDYKPISIKRYRNNELIGEMNYEKDNTRS